MNTIFIISLLFIHWIGDFVLQSDKEAKGKSTNIWYLLSHTLTYSIALIFGIIIIDSIYYINFENIVFNFIGINFITHTIIDYFTSKLNSNLWTKGKIHWFFVSIGFDQFLHLSILLLSFKYYLN